jgi:hypothetical protein
MFPDTSLQLISSIQCLQSMHHNVAYMPLAIYPVQTPHLHPRAPVTLRSLAKAVSFCIFLCYEANAEVICCSIEISALLFTHYILITIFILDIAFLFPALSSFPSPLGSPSIRTIAFPTHYFSFHHPAGLERPACI